VVFRRLEIAMRNSNYWREDLPALEFDAGVRLGALAPPLPIVIENVPFAAWEAEQRAWDDTVPAGLV
jgi:hypothetical protein